MKSRRAEVCQQLAQIDVGGDVVAAAGLVERFAAALKPAGHAYAIAKRRQFQQRQVESAAVEAHQRGPAVFLPAPPEVLGNHVRPELRLVQHHDVFQVEIGRDLAHRHRDRHLEAVRDEVAFVFLQQLVAIAAHRLGGRKPLAGISQFGHNAASATLSVSNTK